MGLVKTFVLVLTLFQQGHVGARTRADDHRTHVADIRLLKGNMISDKYCISFDLNFCRRFLG